MGLGAGARKGGGLRRIGIPGPFKYTSALSQSEVIEHEVDRFIVRDLVRIVFFVLHDNFDIAPEVSHALDSYWRAVSGQQAALFEYTCCDWEPSQLSDLGWERIRNTLSPKERRYADDDDRDRVVDALKDGADPYFGIYGEQDSGFSFEYHARIPWREPPRGSVSVLQATLPTELLEDREPGFVRELALLSLGMRASRWMSHMPARGGSITSVHGSSATLVSIFETLAFATTWAPTWMASTG